MAVVSQAITNMGPVPEYKIDLKDLREQPDVVEQPAHYVGGELEHWDALEVWASQDRDVPAFVLCCLTHAFGYLWRIGRLAKSGRTEGWKTEIRKMIAWLERALEVDE